MLERILKLTIVTNGDSSIMTQKGSCYLTNHVSILDFFINIYLCKGGMHLSRYKVAALSPFGILIAHIFRIGVICFRRGNPSSSKRVISKWISYNKNGFKLILYPEETRRGNLPRLGRLRKGVLRELYNNNIPVVIYTTYGHHAVSSGILGLNIKRYNLSENNRTIAPLVLSGSNSNGLCSSILGFTLYLFPIKMLCFLFGFMCF